MCPLSNVCQLDFNFQFFSSLFIAKLGLASKSRIWLYSIPLWSFFKMYSWWSFHVFLVEHFLTETLVCLFIIQLLRLICLGFQTHFYFPFSSLEKFHFLSLVSCSFQSFIQFKLSGRTRQGGGQSKARQGKASETGERTFDGAPSFMQLLLLLAHLNIWHTWTFGTLEHLAH